MYFCINIKDLDIMLYYSLIYPFLTYGIQVWGLAPNQPKNYNYWFLMFHDYIILTTI